MVPLNSALCGYIIKWIHTGTVPPINTIINYVYHQNYNELGKNLVNFYLYKLLTSYFRFTNRSNESDATQFIIIINYNSWSVSKSRIRSQLISFLFFLFNFTLSFSPCTIQSTLQIASVVYLQDTGSKLLKSLLKKITLTYNFHTHFCHLTTV